ncbi:HCL653Wp [Eremothecium sinecaudum]|uniref:HCL653Wp n=1 Tax=Eremothecium sinecaudum TaxID=45286 RepID=A0A109UXT3_9SACH|nr:HCL653Wp [Eremothecium sinecaudum]AMD19498.1 HCL653Wp [Eremothecium sinecaudum]
MPVSLTENEELFVPDYTKKKQSNVIQDLAQPFDKVQLTKLLINTLHELGYKKSAVQLENESGGIQVESTTVQLLFDLVKTGNFEKCTINLLFRLPLVNGDLSHLLRNNRNSTSSPVKAGELAAYDESSHMVKVLKRQYQILYLFVQRLSIYEAADILKLTTVMEIFVLLLRQIFIELVLVNQDKKLALTFLRTVVRPSIQLWDSLLTIQTIPAEEDPADELNPNPDTMLLQMTTLLTCPLDSIEATEIWGGSIEASRQMTLDRISQYINPNDLVPRGRLITLLKQAIQFQRSGDLLVLSNDRDSASKAVSEKTTYNLLQDNVGALVMFQFSHVKTLAENKDEIWYLQFSPDGRYLASASADTSSDRKVLVYDVMNDFKLYKVLAGTEQSVLYLSFSPDSQRILTCSFNEDVKVYNIHDEGQPWHYNDGNAHSSPTAGVIDPCHSITVTLPETHSSDIPASASNTRMRMWCSAWFNNQPNLVALGSTDREVIIYDLEVQAIKCRLSQTSLSAANATLHGSSTSPPPTNSSSKDQFLRVHAVSISPDDNYLICMSNETFIDVYDVSAIGKHHDSNHEIRTPRVTRLNIGKKMTSMSGPVGSDHSLLLISVQSQELQLWDFKRQIMVQRYVGQRQVAYIIRSCFGHRDDLVASGSEDGKIYIWDRYYGNIIGVLSGHTLMRPDGSRSRNLPMNKICNVVTWNPANPCMFASGGDDGLVKIWRVDPS